MQTNLSEVAEDSIRGGTSLLLGVGIATIVTGIGAIITTRLLGPVNYGVYTLVLILPTLLASFSIFGIDVSLVRYIPKYYAEGKDSYAWRTLKAGLILRIVIAIAVSVFGFLGSDFFCTLILNRPELTPYVQLVSLSLIFEAFYWASFYAFQGLNKMSWSASTRLIQALSKTALAITLIIAGFGMFGALIGYVLSFVVTSAIALGMLLTELIFKKHTYPQDFSNMDSARQILHYGLLLYIVTIIAAIALQYRFVLLAMFTSDTVVGNFKAALNISTLLSGPSFAVLTALLPAFSKTSMERPNQSNKQIFNLAHRYIAMILVPMAIAIMVLSNEIATVLYGPGFEYVAEYLFLFSSIFLLVGIGNGILESYFNGMGENKLTLMFWIVHLIIFIPLGYVLTQLYGVSGLIWAEIISRAVACTMGFWRGHAVLGISIDAGGLARVYLSAIVSGIVFILFSLLFTDSSLFVLILGGGVLLFSYLTLLPLTKAIQLSDLALLEKSFKPMRVIYFLIKPTLAYLRFIASIHSTQRNNTHTV